MGATEPSAEPSLSRLAAGLWRLPSWNLTAPELARWTHAVADLGVTTIDLADIYGGYTVEESFGAALREAPGLRDRLQIVTKCNIKLVNERRPKHTRHVYDSSAAHIIESAENSLSMLGTDRIDTFLLHRQDPLMDPDEVAEAFTQLAKAGKVRAFGVSNFTPSHFAMLESRLPMPLITHQIEASPLCLDPFQDGTLDQALERRVVPMAWSPLAGGRLFSEDDAQAIRVREALTRVGAEHQMTVAATAFAFLKRHPSGIVPVTGTQSLERIAEASAAMSVELSREEWFDIWTASTGASLP